MELAELERKEESKAKKKQKEHKEQKTEPLKNVESIDCNKQNPSVDALEIAIHPDNLQKCDTFLYTQQCKQIKVSFYTALNRNVYIIGMQGKTSTLMQDRFF